MTDRIEIQITDFLLRLIFLPLHPRIKNFLEKILENK